MSDFGGGGIIGAIFGAIVGLFRGFGTGTAEAVRAVVETLRRSIVEIGKQLVQGLWDAARGLARAVRALARMLVDVLKPALSWAFRKLKVVELWLKTHFAPLVKFLKNVKDHIDAFYKQYIRPIIDTIEFIRQLNRVLTALHITVLQKVDDTLAAIENKIEGGFLWVTQQITQLQNVVDRVITLDGFFRKLTLISSMDRYAPTWIRMWWAKQVGPSKVDRTSYNYTRDYPFHEPLEDVNNLTDFFSRGGGDKAGIIGELSAAFLEAANTRPERPA